ncbi:hypothetical protein A2U01_0051750, partial [Trifolium medium]|nr:hypothetical protein [Trifolium medium]
ETGSPAFTRDTIMNP